VPGGDSRGGIGSGALSLVTLLAGLPPAAEMATGEDMECRASAVLAWALENAEGAKWKFSESDPLGCPNCGMPVDRPRSPYCSDRCREIAGWVRQVRRLIAEKHLPDPARAAILGQTLWALLRGGYPGRVAILPARSIQRVIARNEGKCEFCSQPATSVDHIGTACNREFNLRPVCSGCARTRPFGDPEIIGRAELAEMQVRAVSREPLRVCDADEWNWRALVSLRKNFRA